MRCLLSMLTLLASLALQFGTEAQTPGAHRGLLLGLARRDVPTVSHLLQLTPSNAPRPLLSTSPNGAWPFWSNPPCFTMDADNSTVLMPVFLKPGVIGLIRWDPVTRIVVGPLWSGAPGSIFSGWTNLTLDSNGDPVTVDPSHTTPQLAIFDRLQSKWRAIRIPGTAGTAGVAGLVWDKALGEFVHASGNGPIRVYRSDAAGVTRQVASSATLTPNHGGDLADSGDWVSSGRAYYIAPASSNVVSVGGSGAPLYTLDDVTHEKWASAGRGFYATQQWVRGTALTGGVFYIDPSRSPPTVTRIWQNQFTLPAETPGTEIIPLFERDLVTIRSGKATWAVSINPSVPALAGKPFVIAASLSGARPPVVLPDGREIYLHPDAITRSTLAGPMPPFLTGNIGILSATGRGLAGLDFSSAGTALNGLTVHLAGVILDPGAPSGIAWVLDPWAFRVDVIP